MATYNPFRFTKPRNRKETKGRRYRKQFVPLYSQKELEKMVKDGVPLVEVAHRSRQKKLILHENY